jgi:hypothetical protein
MAVGGDHFYAPYAEGAFTDRLICKCSHVELVDGNLSAALERMNAHIRGSYTDAEWEVKMQKTKLATLDSSTGDLKMPSEGPKS